MLVEVKKIFQVNKCNDCPYFKEVTDTSCCFDSFDEPNYDWYCTNEYANNKGTAHEEYNNEHGQSLGGAYHRNVECNIPDWCPCKKIEHCKQNELIDCSVNKENFAREAIKKHNYARLRAITVFKLVNPDIQWNIIENVSFITNDSIDYTLLYLSEDGEKKFNYISLPLKYMWMDNEQIIQDYKNSKTL